MNRWGYYECETCDREFGSRGAVNQHMNALDHWAERWECETCSDEFLSEDDCNEHMDDFDHWGPKIECEACNARFYTHQQARRHMDSKLHWRNHWCQPCQRGFQNGNNLRMHQNGAAHRSNIGIPCPFCKKGFTTASGVAHHAETGSCPKARNVNREVIFKAIRARDRHGVITPKMLEWHGESNATYEANHRSWNGYAYECYLCHRDVTSLASLNQHLNSPTHKQKIYHCMSRSCGKEFTALASLFAHLESESCGAMRFDKVQTTFKGIMTGQKTIAY